MEITTAESAIYRLSVALEPFLKRRSCIALATELEEEIFLEVAALYDYAVFSSAGELRMVALTRENAALVASYEAVLNYLLGEIVARARQAAHSTVMAVEEQQWWARVDSASARRAMRMSGGLGFGGPGTAGGDAGFVTAKAFLANYAPAEGWGSVALGPVETLPPSAQKAALMGAYGIDGLRAAGGAAGLGIDVTGSGVVTLSSSGGIAKSRSGLGLGQGKSGGGLAKSGGGVSKAGAASRSGKKRGSGAAGSSAVLASSSNSGGAVLTSSSGFPSMYAGPGGSGAASGGFGPFGGAASGSSRISTRAAAQMHDAQFFPPAPAPRSVTSASDASAAQPVVDLTESATAAAPAQAAGQSRLKLRLKTSSSRNTLAASSSTLADATPSGVEAAGDAHALALPLPAGAASWPASAARADAGAGHADTGAAATSAVAGPASAGIADFFLSEDNFMDFLPAAGADGEAAPDLGDGVGGVASGPLTMDSLFGDAPTTADNQIAEDL